MTSNVIPFPKPETSSLKFACHIIYADERVALIRTTCGYEPDQPIFATHMLHDLVTGQTVTL